jgi:hypothetical protein
LVLGAVIITVAALTPVLGAVCVPLRYSQPRVVRGTSGAPAAYIATQSVGLLGPLATATAMLAPGATTALLAPFTVIDGDGGGAGGGGGGGLAI